MSAYINKTMAVTLGLVTSAVVSLPAFGWGQTGHRVTGAIAQQYLSPMTQAAVAQLFPEGSLAEAATLADENRSEHTEFWQKTSPPWHYVTVPAGKHYKDVGAPPQGDAYTALQQFTKTLLDDHASMDDKRLALHFIVHIIGDLHQPLHVGNGTDKGGNDVKVRFYWEDSNLHSVWDSGMIDKKDYSYTEWTKLLTAKISPADIQAWADINPLDWMEESAAIRDTIYPQDANKMSYDYLHENLPTAETRLQQAGVRIAMYLNSIFDQAIKK